MSDQLLQTFLSECGASGPIQLIAQNPATGDTLRRTVEQPFAVIGRNPNADVPLSDEDVSHRHAYLQVYEGRVFCVDLKSRTGTHWENGPQEYGWLEGKQVIRVGSYRIRRVDGEEGREVVRWPGGEVVTEEKLATASLPHDLTTSPPHDLPLVSRPLTPLGLSAVSLEFLPKSGDPELDEPLAHWKVQRVLALVGRGSTCKVRLVHPSVSRVHCSLVRTTLGLWVIDLLGRKGTLVNGAPVSFALLEDGDRLQIGRFQIRVRYEPPADSDSTDGRDWEDFVAEEAQSLEADSPSHIVMVSSAPSETPDPESSPDLSPLPSLPPQAEEDSGGDTGTPIEAVETNPVSSPLSPGGREDGGEGEQVSAALAPSPLAPLSLGAKGDEGEAEQVSVALAPSPLTPLPRRGEGKGRRSSRKRALVRSSNRALSKAEWMETILPAITDQFAQMQQQMFDQFQHGMVMMFRTFGQLHREQMDMVRQELDRIHQLTQQLHDLQMELAKHPAAARDPAVQEMLAAIPPVTSLPEAATLVPPEEAWEAAIRAKIEEREAKIEEPHEDSPLVVPALAGNEDRLKAELQTEPQDESPLVVPASAGDEEADEEKIAPPEPPPVCHAFAANEPDQTRETTDQAAKACHPAETNEDIHVLLCRQIAALQKERQTRWQRILRFLTGKSSSKPVP